MYAEMQKLEKFKNLSLINKSKVMGETWSLMTDSQKEQYQILA